jgi:K+-sensing histidine kinase KdpD
MTTELKRPSPEVLLANLKGGQKPTLRVYIGAAPGVGKTYQMLGMLTSSRGREST